MKDRQEKKSELLHTGGYNGFKSGERFNVFNLEITHSKIGQRKLSGGVITASVAVTGFRAQEEDMVIIMEINLVRYVSSIIKSEYNEYS